MLVYCWLTTEGIYISITWTMNNEATKANILGGKAREVCLYGRGDEGELSSHLLL